MLRTGEIEGLCETRPGLEAGCCRSPQVARTRRPTCFTSAPRRIYCDKRRKPWLARTDTGLEKLDRRELLKGLSTLPALGLFGYAWNKQRQYQQAGRRPRGGARGARRPPSDQRRAPGARAQGQVLRRDASNPRPPLPRGVRRLDGIQPEARRQQSQRYKHELNALRGLPRDARQGEGARRGHHRDPRFLALAARRWTASRPASTSTARRRCRTRSRGRAAWWRQRRDGQAPPDRPSAPLAIRATCTATTSCSARRAARPHRDRQRAMEPAVTPDLGAPDRYAIPAERLKKYGFKDMHQFRNWRWYKGRAAVRSWISARTRSTSTAGSSAPIPRT